MHGARPEGRGAQGDLLHGQLGIRGQPDVLGQNHLESANVKLINIQGDAVYVYRINDVAALNCVEEGEAEETRRR